MTREEAIKWLNAIKEKYIRGGDEEFDRRRKVAVDMAIKALEQPEKFRCDSCRYKSWDAFSYPCIDCGRGFLHYEATNILPSDICGQSMKAYHLRMREKGIELNLNTCPE